MPRYRFTVKNPKQSGSEPGCSINDLIQALELSTEEVDTLLSLKPGEQYALDHHTMVTRETIHE